MDRPTIALFAGDPAGIGPELVARLLADGEAARRANILLIASHESFHDGLQVASAPVPYAEGTARDTRGRDLALPLLVDWPGLSARGFERGVACAKNGRFMLEGLAFGVELCREGLADALCFAPLNKSALRAGGMDHPDEMHWFAEVLAWTGPCVEFNVLEGLWTSRITSHVPLKDVAGMLTVDGVAEGVGLLYRGLQSAGNHAPKLAVCALNPHGGDGGNFGREEIEIIEPGVRGARERGWPADGPFPADTIFVRAQGGAYDGIVTMYHDQGQIAMKLMGFDSGVTLHGGLPVPVTTCASGSAFDIVGRNIARPDGLVEAFNLAARIASRAVAGR